MGWGGKRRGAGRKPAGERAGVPHVKRPRLVVRFPVLVTMRLRGGLESLRTNEAHALVSAAFAAGSPEEFRVIEYSIQSNHVAGANSGSVLVGAELRRVEGGSKKGRRFE